MRRLKQNSGERSRVTWSSFYYVITCFDIIVHDKCCFHLKCLLYVRHFLNMAMSIYTSNSNTCISQNIPEYQNAGFEVKAKIFWWFF